jgi:hypothetical protein
MKVPSAVVGKRHCQRQRRGYGVAESRKQLVVKSVSEFQLLPDASTDRQAGRMPENNVVLTATEPFIGPELRMKLPDGVRRQRIRLGIKAHGGPIGLSTTVLELMCVR